MALADPLLASASITFGGAEAGKAATALAEVRIARIVASRLEA
jgi:hypothetical protein